MEVVIGKAVVDKLSGIIAPKASEKITLVWNFKEDFEWLKLEFTSITGCLEFADSRAVQVKPIKTWLHRFREVAWDAEDIVDECAVRPTFNPDELIFRCKMAKRIQEVRKVIRSITESGQKLDLFRKIAESASGQPSSSTERKESRLLPIDSRPVSIEPKLQELISMINETNAPVIAVVGMGGAGKTFLVQNVFDRVDQSYKYKIWLSISKLYDVHQLQIDLASYKDEIDENIKNMKDELKFKDKVKKASRVRKAELIHEALQGNKSLIVLDDVWRAERESNIIESIGLPIGRESQCKVVVTSRDRECCKKLDALLYNMELLSDHESWQLFRAHAFGGEPPDHLEMIARQVEKKCRRLPLALKIVGASLSGCTEIRQWNFKLDQLMKFVDPNSDLVMEILKLSYDSLPPELKVCFSYLSFFPEDERIDSEYLINLWIAEGFIPQGKYQRDVACRYLDQLANLCLLEVEEDEFQVKYCKIHDLLLDLAIAISKEHNCAFAAAEVVISTKRILLPKKKNRHMDIVQRDSRPRSLRTLSLYGTPIAKVEKKFVSPMRLLRVLDLSKTKISTLPPCVGQLKILKLLNLSCTNIKKVPKCVKSLKSLLFLDLSDCELERLPKWINKLKCLQHLNIIGCNDDLLSHMPKEISKLVALRVLRSNHLRLSVGKDGLLKLEDVAKLTCLQEVSIEVNPEMQDTTFALQLEMRHLSLKSTLSGASYQLPNLSGMQYLQTLKLENFAVPNWLCALTELVYLKLANCECTHYPELQKLPNLKKLILDGNNSCKEQPKAFGKPSGFPKLRFLTIMNFSHLLVLPDLEDGAMPVLEEFYVGSCPLVKNVPKGLEWLTKLKKFYYSGDETDELNRGQKFWDSIRANIKDKRGSQVEIFDTFI